MVFTNEKKDYTKRTQRVYSLAFKLQVIDEVEKFRSPGNKVGKNLGFKAEALFWYG